MRPRGVWLIALLAGAIVAAPSGAAWSSTTEDTTVTWAVTPANAAGPDGRRVVDLSLDPGQVITEHFAVRNLSEVEATFALTAADGYYTSAGRFNMLPAGETSVGAGTWISVEPAVTIAAGETAVVPYSVTVPDNATPGDHAAGIAASVRSSSADEDGTQIGVDSRVGFRVSTRVTGELAPSLGVSGLTGAYSPSWNLLAPGHVTVVYTARNTGNTALAVQDRLGDAAASRGNLLPGETREVILQQDAWPLGLLFLDFAVEGVVPADTLITAPHTDSLMIWAVPWLHLLTLVGLLLIALAVFAGRRRNKRRLEQLLEEARAEGRRDVTEAVPTS